MQSSYGNCMTELVTEIPRSFSSAIQSEVAWRDALRDFTLPAIWIAPPNSSSFSVSVVLPASGCEMIAKVRRRRTSAARSVMSFRQRSDRGNGAQRALEHRGIFAAARGLIVAAAHADLPEPQ